MNQPHAVARRTDPSTSHAAAASISSSKLRSSQVAVLEWLREHGPATDEALVELYNGPDQSPSGLRTRRRELVEQRLVRDSGARQPLASGRMAIVWEVVPPRPPASARQQVVDDLRELLAWVDGQGPYPAAAHQRLKDFAS